MELDGTIDPMGAEVPGLGATVMINADLPIATVADALIEAITAHQVIVVAGETGSGKSTQLPKLCLLAGRGSAGLIGHTQPRRVAARSVAERVASELGSKVGDTVGYTVRFNDQVSTSTRIQVMTDGILLNEIQRDPMLRRYDTLIVDEAHERSLNIDFILGYLRQLLPKRPDLRVIVTSATIDTERFATHFAADVDHSLDTTSTAAGAAPVFVVEGRTYPVDVAYRPYGPDHDPDDTRDQMSAVLDAIDELFSTIEGDVLVFLSGEREIRDTAQAVDERFAQHPERVEVLPLYARLSAHEQHRIFQPHQGRRVVLATNIAETSITVPGVRSVVDTGTARISRYSKRLKVQRLPIEPISQASANQRAGRCGRVGPGIAIRLYSAEDFDERAEFTDPEILRTNLASVILQMTALGLGDVGRFPFIEPPDRTQINDGYMLLDELGALKPGRIGSPRRLTRTGRQLARLPIDPRLGRMLVEAGRLGCVREVLVIASALSIQDVRERPDEHRERATELHQRFRVPGSDFLSIVALWDYLREQQRDRSSGSFRRMCHAEFLHYLRTREWRDLYSQLRQVAGQLKLRPNKVEAHPDHVHRAVLAGLLSHIGHRDDVSSPSRSSTGRDGRPRRHAGRDRVEYRGARDARFVVAPGSAIGRRAPEWVMAAELTETDRLWARRVAGIEPEWCEPLAKHLVKRSYGEAFWQSERGRAATTETVTLYGRPIVANRLVALANLDPVLAREMFIRHVLVDNDWPNDTPPASPTGDFVAHNARYLQRVRMLGARVRRDDLYDEASLGSFFDARIPQEVVDVASFERWWIEQRPTDPTALDFGISILSNRDSIELDRYPDRWKVGDAEYPIVYRFEPGSALDGASITIPVAMINQFDPAGLDWGIPGYLPDLIATQLASLPKELRRSLIPMADTVDDVAVYLAQHSGADRGPFAVALSDALAEVRDVHVKPTLFRPDRLPSWLRTHMIVVNSVGEVLDAGDDLEAIIARQAGAARAEVATISEVVEQRGLTDWSIGDLAEVIEREASTGVGANEATVRAYPTIVDAGSSVTLRVVDNQGLAERALRGGITRLLLLNAAPRPERIRSSLTAQQQLAIAATGIDVDELTTDAIGGAVDAILGRYPLPRTEAAFRAVEGEVRTHAAQLASDALAESAEILGVADQIHRRAMKMKAASLAPTRDDIIAHRDRLIAPGFIRRTGTDRLPDLHRYLRGIVYRADHLGGDIARDQRRMAEVQPIERAVSAGIAQQSVITAELKSVSWMVEEYRLSVFATPIGVVGQVSPKRIRVAYETATGQSLSA